GAGIGGVFQECDKILAIGRQAECQRFIDRGAGGDDFEVVAGEKAGDGDANDDDPERVASESGAAERCQNPNAGMGGGDGGEPKGRGEKDRRTHLAERLPGDAEQSQHQKPNRAEAEKPCRGALATPVPNGDANQAAADESQSQEPMAGAAPDGG